MRLLTTKGTINIEVHEHILKKYNLKNNRLQFSSTHTRNNILIFHFKEGGRHTYTHTQHAGNRIEW